MQKIEQHNIIEHLEDHADNLIRKTRKYLPTIGKLCVVATFIEDGTRLITRSERQYEYLEIEWEWSKGFIGLLIFSFIFLQLIGSVLVLSSATSKHIQQGCGLLVANIVLYGATFPVYWRMQFMIRLMSKIGELLLLFAETVAEKKTIYAGVPSYGDDPKEKQYLQLFGRLLLVLMFMSLINAEQPAIYLVLGLPMVLSIAVGYKTKLVSIALICALFLHNINRNQFWLNSWNKDEYDYKKNDFFQILSIIGGVIHLLIYGAGGISVDQRLKTD